MLLIRFPLEITKTGTTTKAGVADQDVPVDNLAGRDFGVSNLHLGAGAGSGDEWITPKLKPKQT